MTTFAELLRGYRTARSLTQEELAERAHVTVKAVGALERGERRRPYPHTVRALADALELDEAERTRIVSVVPKRSAPRAVEAAGARAATSAPPEPAAPMIGRDREVAEVTRLLRVPSRRVVTLVGPGGVGKTTLATAVAAAVRDRFPGGVVLVELADVRGEAEVLPAIATALGVPESRFDGGVRALVPFLTGRRVLLVLDNLEHVVAVAPDLADLVAMCPDLVVLTTSRVRLRIRAEQEVRVAGLSPDDSARLFRERVAAAGTVLDGHDRRTAEAIAALCAQADGLPLALELAASAAARFGPAALLDRLDALPPAPARDLPARQRSMAATLTWSCALLGPAARSLLARLSVCIGGFSLATAEQVAEQEPDAVLAALVELLDHSLVTRVADVEGTTRFRLLEPVRQDAAARLDPAERDAARAGVARSALDAARELLDDLRSAGQIPALNLIDANLGNLRVAVEFLLEGPDLDGPDPAGRPDGRPADAAELLWRMAVYLAVRGHAREGRAWAERLRPRLSDDLAQARCLAAQAWMEHLADPAGGCRLAQRAAESAFRAGDDALAAECLFVASSTAFAAGDLAASLELVPRARRQAERAGDPWASALVSLAVGQVPAMEGRYAEAEPLLREAEGAARRLGLSFELTGVLHARAVLCAHQGRDAEAATLLVEALELAVAARNVWLLTFVVSSLAGVAVRLGELVTASRLFGAASYIAAEHAVNQSVPTSDDMLRRARDLAREGLGPAAFDAEWRAGRTADMDDVVALANAVRDRAVHPPRMRRV